MRPAELAPENRTPAPDVPREAWVEGALTVSAAAAFLGCSRKHLFDKMADGSLAWGRLGRSRRIPKGALLDLLASGR